MSTANQSGRRLRDAVSSVLRNEGISHKLEHSTDCYDDLQKRIRVDIYVYTLPAYPKGLYIQCRWQQSTGTADEKIHSEIRKAQLHLDKPTVLVIDGKQTQRGRALATDSISGNLVAVLTLAEFLAYVPMFQSSNGATQLQQFYDAEQTKLFGL